MTSFRRRFECRAGLLLEMPYLPLGTVQVRFSTWSDFPRGGGRVVGCNRVVWDGFS